VAGKKKWANALDDFGGSPILGNLQIRINYGNHGLVLSFSIHVEHVRRMMENT
jgi:hypothetical protein